MVAIARIPIGVAVALEFTGPLTIAPGEFSSALDGSGSRWRRLALLLLSPLIPQPWMAGALYWPCWPGLAGDSIFHCRQKRGKFFRGSDGLAIAMTLGGVVLLPIGILAEGTALLNPQVLLAGLGVALLSSAIP